jgi:hypothetical protein
MDQGVRRPIHSALINAETGRIVQLWGVELTCRQTPATIPDVIDLSFGTSPTRGRYANPR